MKVIKRNGKVVNFNREKISCAIELAMMETEKGIDKEISNEIVEAVEELLLVEEVLNVEEIQDAIEDFLMISDRRDVAKQYIIYRHNRGEHRLKKISSIDNGRLLTDEFISKYKHLPSPMTNLGNFVYYRTYSRFLPDEQRREFWWETVRRAVEYNANLVPNTTRKEAEALFDNIFNLRQFLSGRTFWVGGTPVAEKYPVSNYNCAFTVIDEFEAFRDLFYLLLVGSGVGLRILKDDVAKLPKLRNDFEIIHQYYQAVPRQERKDSTELTFPSLNMAQITVGDSKEGWVQALDFYFKLIFMKQYSKIDTIIINYDNVRPKGEVLKTFGGTASGHGSIQSMFSKIDKIIKKRGELELETRFKLKTIDCLDIANIIGENVVVGGVRRTAQIVLVDEDDQECIDAKSNLYKQVNGEWVVDNEIVHRSMSNNSIYYKDTPSKEKLHWQIEKMRYSGEPGWVNEIAGAKRRPNFNGVNPCGEILLDNHGLCNLTTVNTLSFVENGVLNKDALYEAQKLSARAGYRMTMVELELPKWDSVQARDHLLGCSLTGWQDMVNATNMSVEEQKEVLQELRSAAHDSANQYARELNSVEPLLVTTIKPEGTLSQLPTVSSGVHYSHSPYYIRRVRINANDPLVKVCEELGYPIHAEVGQEWETCTTKVIEFPVKAPEGKTKYNVSALSQLENYKLFMDNYVDHNTSITVSVRNNEWQDVENWVYEHWEDALALSFLSLDDSFYELLPYEAITKEKYEEKAKNYKPFNPTLLQKYEKKFEIMFDIGNDGCDSGACPVR